MKRGEIWTMAGGPGYAGKPRPAVILQDNLFARVDSVTVCPFTTNVADAFIFRVAIEATELNGLRASCRLMADKVLTVPRSKLGARIGHLDEVDLGRLGRALIIFLGLTTATFVDQSQ